MHDTVDVGDRLTLSAPYGDVVLDDFGHPVVFASAGIGVAPHGSHGSLAVDGRFAGTMNLNEVQLPEDAEYYLCGPLPFMRDIRTVLLDRGVRASDIQYEVFGPDIWQADAD